MISAVYEQDTASEPTGSLAYLAWPYLVELEKNSGTPPFSGLAMLLQLSQNHDSRLSATHSGIVLAGPRTAAAMPSS
jgi:hypothetical protein